MTLFCAVPSDAAFTAQRHDAAAMDADKTEMDEAFTAFLAETVAFCQEAAAVDADKTEMDEAFTAFFAETVAFCQEAAAVDADKTEMDEAFTAFFADEAAKAVGKEKSCPNC